MDPSTDKPEQYDRMALVTTTVHAWLRKIMKSPKNRATGAGERTPVD
jgi:hypothetical protein